MFTKVDMNGRYYTTNPLNAPGKTTNGNTGKAWRGMLPPKGRYWRYDPAVLDELDARGLIEWSSTGNPRKIVYADEMPYKKLRDIGEFKDPPRPIYPTEKNIDLLKTIVSTSSNRDSLVLDCFCGSGGALVAADELQRCWIGIDGSEVAIRIALKRVQASQQGLFKDQDELPHLVAA